MVIPLFFLAMLSSFSTDMHKQLTSQQHSMQDDNNSILLFCMHCWAGLDYYLCSIVHKLLCTLRIKALCGAAPVVIIQQNSCVPKCSCNIIVVTHVLGFAEDMGGRPWLCSFIKQIMWNNVSNFYTVY